MNPDLNPENDPLLMATAHSIWVGMMDHRFGRAEIIRILADYHSAIRTENARLRAQVEELLALRQAAPIIIGKVEGR